jgi:DNA-binding transcriptional LysR family regulator
MNLLESLSLFIRIVERGGLAAAGRDLGLSPAAVTERLAGLEAHYSARLLHRTTRAISLTDEGRRLLDGSRQLVSDAADMEARIRLGVERISGPIRLSAPIDLGCQSLMPTLDAFLALHPDVSIELVLSDGYVDLAAQGIDLALRLGDLKDSSMHAVRLGPNRRVVCASPAYLSRRGVPQRPGDLQQHNCLLMRFGAGVDREWAFAENGRRSVQVVSGNRCANDGGIVREWCLLGHGIALKSEWNVRDDLRAGRLVPLLEAFEPAPTALQLLYAGGAAMPRRVRALIDLLVVEFSHATPSVTSNATQNAPDEKP